MAVAPGASQQPYVRQKPLSGAREGIMAEDKQGSSGFADLFAQFADIVTGQREHDRIKDLPPERGVQMRGKVIDGVQYLRAEDVADLLAANSVLPKAEALIRRTVARVNQK